AKAGDEAVEPAVFETVIQAAVIDVVRRQAESGVDVVSDGEMSKLSYATYVSERLTGFEGDSPRRTPADLVDYPTFATRAAGARGTSSYRRPRCTGPVAVKDLQPLHDDLRRLAAALEVTPRTDAFMNAASPGVIALFQPNDYYPSDDAYLAALADAMHTEYAAVVDSGRVLQVDAPDLALGRHMQYRDLDDAGFRARAEASVEALNHALRGIPPDRVRLHVCWGNYEGPHTHDIPLERVLPVLLKAKVGVLSFEAANPRHAHEWRVFKDAHLPDNLVLMPGVLDSTTNFVEHPLLVMQRICTFATIVGRERVLAGSDCGFASFAGFGTVDPDIAFAKLAALSEGAALASEELW
ncbi:MAG: cobalamin-independent methionine synthase II family protein, partial [Chloroflexota bacterium]